MVIENTKKTPITFTIQGEAIEQVDFVYLFRRANNHRSMAAAIKTC